MKLGIDFGTTRTVVAAASGGRVPLVVFDVGGEFVDHIPGLARLEGGRLDLGWDAREGGRTGLVRSIKRLVTNLAPDDAVPGFNGMSATELLTAFLSVLRDKIVHASNLGVGADEPLAATVAVPANATSQQRFATMEAFRRAGFELIGVLNEPTAAAVELAHQDLSLLNPRSPKRYVVIYDLGGGTFDTAAVSLDGRRFELLETEGLRQMGGDDFDELILEATLSALGPASMADELRAAALEVCREAKETLRPATKRLLVDLTSVLPESRPVTLETATLYDAAMPLIDKTIELVREVFARIVNHQLDPEDPKELGGVYLVGGAVQFPPVARRLRQLFGRKILLARQPHAATAIGLAVAASPEDSILVRETATRHFGVWRETDHGHKKVFDPIFAKGARPGTDNQMTVTRDYRPSHAVGHLRFLECTALDAARGPAGDLTPCGELLFPYDPLLADRPSLHDVPALRRSDLDAQEIHESYTYLADGTVRVDIENRTRGYRRSCIVGQSFR